MRIISGALGGRHLRSLPGEGTRPAMGKAREALFSMLEARGLCWDNAKVLDLYAGTGSLAFECLSRGAATAVAVDSGKEACACLRANGEAFGLLSQLRIVCSDALKFLRRDVPTPYELVFIDPPYRRNYLQPCLDELCTPRWLKPGAFVSVEIENTARIVIPPALNLETERLLGQTCLKLFKYAVNNDENCHVSGDF